MTITSRTYRDDADLQKMKQLVTERAATHPFSTAHLGDVDWWLFYDSSGLSREERIRLWEDENGRLVAWTFGSPKGGDYDLALHPNAADSLHEQIIVEMEAFYSETVRQQPLAENERHAVTLFAFEDDAASIAILESRGYEASDFIFLFAQSITGDLPQPILPEGFRFLDTMREDWADKRADVHFDAFSPRSRMTADYYRNFMQAPGYDPTMDIVTVAPDGRFASFAMSWVDPINKLSLFEPVGTRHEFHRRGLGRATLLEGLRRLKACGMEMATVGCAADKPGNIAFYESVGFQKKNLVRRYKKLI